MSLPIVPSVSGLDRLLPTTVIRSVPCPWMVAVRTGNGWNQVLDEGYDRPSTEFEWALPFEILWEPLDTTAPSL